MPFIEEALTILSIKLDQIPLTSSSGKSSQIRSKRKMLLNKIEEISKRIEFICCNNIMIGKQFPLRRVHY